MKLGSVALFSLLVLAPSWALGWGSGGWNGFAVTVEEDGRLGRTFTAEARYCHAKTPVRWDFGDGSVGIATIGGAVSHRYPIGGTYNVQASSLCGTDSEEVKVDDLFLPEELKTALEQTLNLASAPDIPGDWLSKGQYDELRLWDWIAELLEASGDAIPVLSPEMELWLLKTDAKLELSRYLGAPVDFIEIPKEDMIRGITQLFVLRIWELAFDAALGVETERVELSHTEAASEPPTVSTDALIEASLESHLDPEDNSNLKHVRNVFRFWSYLGANGCIKERYTLNDATAATLKGMLILVDNAALWLDDEFSGVMEYALAIDTISDLTRQVRRTIERSELTDEEKFREILQTVYFLNDNEVEEYESRVEIELGIGSGNYAKKLNKAVGESVVTDILFKMGKERGKDSACTPIEHGDGYLEAEGLWTLFEKNDLDALFLINRLSLGSLAVGMAVFTHINGTLDSTEFEDYLRIQPGEGELNTIRKAVLSFTILYYRYFRAVPEPFL